LPDVVAAMGGSTRVMNTKGLMPLFMGLLILATPPVLFLRIYKGMVDLSKEYLQIGCQAVA